MKKYKEIKRNDVVTVLDSMFCDVCGKKANYDDWVDPPDNYAVSEIEIRSEEGSRYPEGGDVDIVEFDICPECFSEHVVKHLISLGAAPRKRNENSF